ncbi:MAG TPA: hypothetical protein VNT03_00700 [Baekduia sp.]|nr:hypothetical protein [Baekduia sp.]
MPRVLTPAVRRAGSWWLVATLVGVFPANVHMARNADRHPQIPKPALCARLAFQLVFIRRVLAAGRR